MVTVQDGIVFLKGTTETDEFRQWAGNLAKNTQGGSWPAKRSRGNQGTGAYILDPRGESLNVIVVCRYQLNAHGGR